ncbi:MAG: hypothetical protein PHE92_02915 [Candidatus Cloacimonetes bacterium]|jgi:hypothetical protein|nr:hypothetical protein [Candidatus Cloacimonadota bacterium]MDK2851185.1 hypothetical protein [Candidatus Cloacimonadota bacterium]
MLLKRNVSLTGVELAEHFENSKASLNTHFKFLRFSEIIYAKKKGQYTSSIVSIPEFLRRCLLSVWDFIRK